MRQWQVTFDTQERVHVHRTPPGFGHALLVPAATAAFSTLRIAASLTDGKLWWPIHNESSVQSFEVEHGGLPERIAYNARCFAEVRSKRRTVRGTHAGLHDLFVPVVARGQLEAILVVGPFARTRATSGDVLERWRRLTGRQGHLADPEFATFLTANLNTLVLDADILTAFERLLGCLAGLLGQEGSAAVLANEAEKLHLELWQTRFVERTWEATRAMVDDRFPRTWHSVARADDLRILGLSRVPELILACLTVGRGKELDPIDEAIRRDAFQRSAVELARKVGGVIAGQIGDHGVVFLASASGSAQRNKRTMSELARGATELARKRYGLALHVGASEGDRSTSLSGTYQAALAAAESALSQGVEWVHAASETRLSRSAFNRLRHELGSVGDERPHLLAPLFDRYLEAVMPRCGYRMEPARAHLDFGFERMTEVLVRRAALDQKSLAALEETLEHAASSARTLSELAAAYRTAVADVVDVIQRPGAARHDRSVRRAVDFIREHFAERLSLKEVARIAGYAPAYFSKLFKEGEGMTFEHYLRRAKLERARQMLRNTELPVTRVAEICGFPSLQYFFHVFRQIEGATPLEFRRRKRRRSGGRAA